MAKTALPKSDRRKPVSRKKARDHPVGCHHEIFDEFGRAVVRRLREIADSPDSFEDFVEADDSGRELTGHLFGGFAIVFWDDFADRHLKVLEITSADELEE